MDHERIQSIESLFQEKALLYAELLECFRKEREHLSAMNIELLWGVADEKTRLCSGIGALRSRIASLLCPGRDLEERDVSDFLQRIPARQQGPFRNVLLRIMKLKSEVDLMRKENQTLIDESLDFLDGMISILAGEGAGRSTYSERSRLCRTETLVTMSREV